MSKRLLKSSHLPKIRRNRREMEGEIHNFMVIWAIVLTSLCYSHTIAKFFPKGKSRFLAIIPIVCLFFTLPLYLTSINLGSTTSFFIAWLANFKLLLFAFGKGPLSSTPPLPLSTFIPLACLPIKFQSSSTKTIQKNTKSSLNLVTKIALLAILIKVYNYKDHLHPKIILFFYCLHIYFVLEIMLTTVSTMVRVVSRVELEPPFDEPYKTSSLQDFWGKRWNLMVTNILRPAVYDPVRFIMSDRIPRKWAPIPAKWAPLPAVLATFFVSGLMHELIFYYISRLNPSWEVTCFFIIHGVALTLEIMIKKLLNGKFLVPRIISGPLALGFIILTSFWLFFPPLLRGKPDVKGCTESLAFLEFIRYGKLVNPSNITCPFL
ncbi:acyl-CoA--sterol O-acyltransferase 1-like [Nicotiana tabacum]|uniref:Acyl-CoA--sterol O-acyltransferase 1-like n=2 Tax=Nicotiana TaxID=4085 RepID=A0AC58SJQ2_TOBAC|nr:PREDICTED: acyl-CoA--sterol O-acyltransferase 1-like [Nicotiana tabacum]